MKLHLLVLGLLVAAPVFADRMPAPATQAAPPAPGHNVRMPPPPPPPPPQPTPLPPEIGTMAKRLVGSYACKGMRFDPNGSSTPLVAKLAIKTVLAGAWIEATLVETGAGGVELDDFRTFDPVAQQWNRVQVATGPSSTRWTSLGEKNGAWTWEGTTATPSGTSQQRDHEQLANRTLKLWGEGLLGGGWQKLYELTCTR